MNSKNIVAIEDSKIKYTCMHCLKEFDEKEMHEIHIPDGGDGSYFDDKDTYVYLCDDCYRDSIKDCPNIWSMKHKEYEVTFEKNDHLTEEERAAKRKELLLNDDTKFLVDARTDIIYDHDITRKHYRFEYEKEMLKYMDALSLQSKELIVNRLNDGHYNKKMDGQDWIDYQLYELSYEKAKKYGLPSNEDIIAYRRRYVNCCHVVNQIYEEGTKDSICLLNNVSGGYGGIPGRTVSLDCYKCEYYKKREGEIRELDKLTEDEVKKIRWQEMQDSKFVFKTKLFRRMMIYYAINIGWGKIPDDYNGLCEGIIINVDNDEKYLTVIKRSDFKKLAHNETTFDKVKLFKLHRLDHIVCLGVLDESGESLIKEIEEKCEIGYFHKID